LGESELSLLFLPCSTCFEQHYRSSSGAFKLCFGASGDTYVRHCLPVLWENQNCIYCPFIAVHVSSDIIAHHEELLFGFFTFSGNKYMRQCRPVSLVNQNSVYFPFIALHVSSVIIPHYQGLLNSFLQLLLLHTCVTACRCRGRIRTEFIVSSLLYMFLVILSLIIRSF
jgi:hypothetical protein